MGKTIKKMMALAIAMVMVLAMGTSVFADDEVTGSITVTDQKIAAGQTSTTFEAYRIFDLAANADYTALAYTINSDWTGFFTGTGAGAAYIVDTNDSTANNGEGYTPIVVNGAVKYIALTDSNIAAFGKAALAYSTSANLTPVGSNTNGSFTDLPLGYYMVYPKGANINVSPYTSIVSLTTTKPNATVVQKAEYPTLEKTDDDNSVEVGQTVTYTLTSKVPDTTGYETFTFEMNDDMTKGLTFGGEGSITVTIGDTAIVHDSTATGYVAAKDFTYTTATSANEGGTAFKISIPVMQYQDKIGAAITVTYTATVNDNAVTKIDKNHATLTYSRNPKNSEDKTTTPPDEEKVFSAKIVINKYDATNTAAKLKDAKFVLRCKSVTDTGAAAKAEAGKYYKYTAATETTPADVSWVAEEDVNTKVTAGEYALVSDVKNGATIVTTDSNGVAEFAGLENGVYELIEVEAPEGYNQIKGVAKEITINGNDESEASLTATADIENNSGTELPSTGGMGTTIFYVIGGILVLAAAIILISRRKVQQ